MQKIPLGARAKTLGINRANVADGQSGRAVLLDTQPQFKYIAYDENLRRRVEVNQDMVIKYGLKPITYYYYLIARLNTDLNGNVVGTKFVVEYIQLSENVNNDFADAITELGGSFTQLKLTKVTKKSNNRDFSYLKPIPSNLDVDSEIMEMIERIRQEPGAIEAMWQLVDRATSITPEEYEELRKNPQQLEADSQPQVRQVAAPEQRRELPPQTAAPVMPQAQVESFGAEFQNADGFQDF